MANPTKEINYRGRTERYEIVDGYLEMFVGYVHKAESPAEQYREWRDYTARNFPIVID